MKTDTEIKEIVKDKYGQIARDSSSCCGPTSCCGSSKAIEYSMINDEYTALEGYVPEADLGLGCGLPTEFANIQKGNTVLDLGSGAGNDVFVARALVGNEGFVIGVDMTQDMIQKANANKAKLGAVNVEFRFGEIEKLPVDDSSVDVVVSNCVLNLVPDKAKSFSEIYRVLKSGAHFCISDVVLQGELPETLQSAAEMYVGCVAGAMQQNEYIATIREAGFENVEIQKSKTIELPDEVLREYLNAEQMEVFKREAPGIFSITVVGTKG